MKSAVRGREEVKPSLNALAGQYRTNEKTTVTTSSTTKVSSTRTDKAPTSSVSTTIRKDETNPTEGSKTSQQLRSSQESSRDSRTTVRESKSSTLGSSITTNTSKENVQTIDLITSIVRSMDKIEEFSPQLHSKIPKAVDAIRLSLRQLKTILRMINPELRFLIKNSDFRSSLQQIDDALEETQEFISSLLAQNVFVKARFNKKLKKRSKILERHLFMLAFTASYLRSSAGLEGLNHLAIISGFPQYKSMDTTKSESWMEQAEAYYYGRGISQDYKTAYRFFREAAKLGNANAQYMMGRMCLENKGVDGEEQEIQKQGVDLILHSCKKEHPDALNYMGLLHLKGISDRVPKDPTLAVEYFSAAAKKNHLEGMCNLAQSLLDGVGCKQDREQALVLVTKCCEKNHPRALTLLGKMYYCGTGVKKNYDLAVEYFKRAAEMNHDSGLNSLGVAHEEGKGVVRDLKKAAYFYERAKDLGNINAYNNLGYLKLIQKEYLEGREYLLVAARHDHVDALYNLGQIYQQGLGVGVDLACAYQYFLKAARGGHYKACTKVGDILFSGDPESGIDIDYKTAFSFYKNAAKHGEPDAQNALGIMFEEGIHVPVSFEQAFFWYNKAVEESGRQHAQALFNLGSLYVEGKGCELNRNEAVKLFSEAAFLGHSYSREALAQLDPNNHAVSAASHFEKRASQTIAASPHHAVQSANRASRDSLHHSSMTPVSKARPISIEPQMAESPIAKLSPIQKRFFA